jgi:hypothetical protein
VPDAEVPVERGEVRLLEGLRDETELLAKSQRVAVGDRDASRLLPAVLKRVKTEVDEAADLFARGVHTEDAA